MQEGSHWTARLKSAMARSGLWDKERMQLSVGMLWVDWLRGRVARGAQGPNSGRSFPTVMLLTIPCD